MAQKPVTQPKAHTRLPNPSPRVWYTLNANKPTEALQRREVHRLRDKAFTDLLLAKGIEATLEDHDPSFKVLSEQAVHVNLKQHAQLLKHNAQGWLAAAYALWYGHPEAAAHLPAYCNHVPPLPWGALIYDRWADSLLVCPEGGEGLHLKQTLTQPAGMRRPYVDETQEHSPVLPSDDLPTALTARTPRDLVTVRRHFPDGADMPPTKPAPHVPYQMPFMKWDPENPKPLVLPKTV